jgi:hypothetical protein
MLPIMPTMPIMIWTMPMPLGMNFFVVRRRRHGDVAMAAAPKPKAGGRK